MPKVGIVNNDFINIKTIETSGHPVKILINKNIPFKIKFLPGRIFGSSPTNPAPIGIAIIGVNNYIL